MEVLAILFWLIVLGADIAFMCNIKRIADEWFPWDGKRKRPGRAGTRTRSCRKMTQAVYQIREGMQEDD
jgi:hypothetical protein